MLADFRNPSALILARSLADKALVCQLEVGFEAVIDIASGLRYGGFKLIGGKGDSRSTVF
jgi:hypothetical protein